MYICTMFELWMSRFSICLCCCCWCVCLFIASFLLIWLLFGSGLFAVVVVVVVAQNIPMAIDGCYFRLWFMKLSVLLHVPTLWFNKNKFRIDLSTAAIWTAHTHTHYAERIYCRCASMGKCYLHFRRFFVQIHSLLFVCSPICFISLLFSFLVSIK